MTDQKLNLNINLGEIRYLEVELLITNQFMTQKFETTHPIDQMKFISAQRFSQSLIVKLDMQKYRNILVQ